MNDSLNDNDSDNDNMYRCGRIFEITKNCQQMCKTIKVQKQMKCYCASARHNSNEALKQNMYIDSTVPILIYNVQTI